MVAAEPTPAHNPGEAAFDDPSSGLRTKAFGEEFIPIDLLSFGHQDSSLGHSEGAYRLHGPVQMRFEPLDEGASVMTVAPDQLHSGKRFHEWQEHLPRPFLIGALGSCHVDFQQVAFSVNQDVPFAPPDFFFPYRSPFRDREPHSF